MTEYCRAGSPTEDGFGGCRVFDRASGRAGELSGTSALLCFWCLEVAERDVRALVLDYRDLEQLLPPSLGQWADGQPRGKSRPLPFSEHVFDLQREIFWLTDTWDAVVRDVQRLSEKPSRTRQGWSVQQSVSILSGRLDVLAAHGPVEVWDYPGSLERSTEVWGWRGVLDLARLHHRARAALGLANDRPALLVGVLCRNCDVKSRLVRDAESGEVRCTACDEWYTAEEYAGWVGLQVASIDKEKAA